MSLLTFIAVSIASALCFASLVLAIVGGVKEKKKFLYGGIAGFFVFGVATALIVACFFVNAISSVSTDSVADTARDVTETGGKITGKMIKGTLTGVANGMEKDFVTDSSVVQAGIIVNHCESTENGLSIYLDFTKDFDGVVALYAYDGNDKKQGFAKDSFHVKAGDEGIYRFDFEEGVNVGFIGHYRLCVRE